MHFNTFSVFLGQTALEATQSQRLEYNHVPFRGRRQGSRMFSSQWTFRLGWPLGRVLLELKAVMAVNERN